MAKLGEFIGALLSDAAQARVRADIEAVKIAESYSAHELLKHLPVPRFRLPDITVDFPVMVTAVEEAPAGGRDRLFDQPTKDELLAGVRKALIDAEVKLPAATREKVTAAVGEGAKRVFEAGPRILLSSARIADKLAEVMVDAMESGTDEIDEPDGRLEQVRKAAKASFNALLLDKLAKSPALQVNVTAAEIKAHGHSDSLVRVRLTISEDAYEVINRDDGNGFTLTPE